MRALILTAVFMAAVGIASLGNLIASQDNAETITLQQGTTPILLAEDGSGSGGG